MIRVVGRVTIAGRLYHNGYRKCRRLTCGKLDYRNRSIGVFTTLHEREWHTGFRV
jgi:hypothetical protein